MDGEDYRALEAAVRNDAAEIQRLRASGVEVNMGFEAGPSPLEASLEGGHMDAFWALLEEADDEILGDALCLAAFFGSVAAFDRLVARGISLESVDEVGENALASAAKGEGPLEGRLAIARRLIDAGIDRTDAIDWANRTGERAMIEALNARD